MSMSIPPRQQDALHTSLLTARSLVLLQLLSRLLTFGLNQSLVRMATPEVFGTAAIQFDLVSSTILFLSREGIRNALLRTKQGSISKEEVGERQVRALSTVPLPLGMAIATAVCTVYLYSSSFATTSQTTFHLSLGLYVLAALLELAVEPLYLRALRSSPPKMIVRVQAEGGMVIAKAIVTATSLLVLKGKPLLGFALGQLAGAAWLAGRYLFEYGDATSLDWVGAARGQSRFDPQTLSLAIANTRQSVIKHGLTEADRIAVGRISPLRDQGGYAVAMNYGSLVARIIFQPVEETLLLHFSTTSPSSKSAPHLLSYALHISIHLLLLLPAFLPPLLPAILLMLLPRRYLHTSAPATLQTYLMWYLPLLSLNGILEAFHSSSARPDQVATQARWMIGGSLVFTMILFSLTRLPDGFNWDTEQALIFANCMSMFVRIEYAWRHARIFFDGRNDELRSKVIAPRWQVALAAGISGVALRLLERSGRWRRSWLGWIELVGLGGGLGLGALGILFIVERRGLAELRRIMKEGKTE